MEGIEMKAKIGVVGAGTYGSVLINAYYGAHKRGEIEFAAIADINPDTLKSMDEKYGIKGYTDYREMFDKEGLDAVAVGQPPLLPRGFPLVFEIPVRLRERLASQRFQLPVKLVTIAAGT